MTDLRLKLDTTDFAKLAELGRSLIPTRAPAWTDHNTHDPGIMVMELLAWVADSQVYALSRSRRDERLAYASLLGVQPKGPTPARGLIWPRDLPRGAQPSWADGHVVGLDDDISADTPDAPVFHVTHPIRLTAAVLARLTSVSAGVTRDWTAANTLDGATFEPFGEPFAGDSLTLQFTDAGFPASTDAILSIGFELAHTDEQALTDAAPGETTTACQTRRVRVSLIDSTGEHPVRVAVDTTGGLLRSGVLLLAGAQTPDTTVSLVIRSVSATGDFLRTPRLQRVGLNVLPIVQRARVTKDVEHFGQGRPNQRYALDDEGLIFTGAESDVRVSVSDGVTLPDWTRTKNLSTCGPDDAVYEFDPSTRVVLFGNGVNGRLPVLKADLQATFDVSRGSLGNLGAGLSWKVQGVGGDFGGNSAPTIGGADPVGLPALRGLARSKMRQRRPYVTRDDLVDAARSFVDLGVRRAVEVLPSDQRGRRVRGTRLLVVVGPHDASPGFVENSDWLGEVRARLLPLLPLGHRLEVVAPEYVDVGMTAELVSAPDLNPKVVARNVSDWLRRKFALTTHGDDEVWPFGRDVALPLVKGWLRRIEGVTSVGAVRLLRNGTDTAGEAIAIGPQGLPRLALADGDIAVARWTRGPAT